MVGKKSHRIGDFFIVDLNYQNILKIARLENFSRYGRIWKLTTIINTRKKQNKVVNRY